MEPLSILSIVGVCCTITARAISIGSDIKTIKKVFKEGYDTNEEINLVAVQVQSLNVATSRLSSWLEDQKAPSLSQDEIACLSDSLDACDTGIARIQEHVLNVKNAVGKVGVRGKVQHWWNENDLKKYQNVLAHQVQAMSLLMSTFSLSDASRRKLLLADSDSQSILEVAKDDASSIYWIHEKEATEIDSLLNEDIRTPTTGRDASQPDPEAQADFTNNSVSNLRPPRTSPRTITRKEVRSKGVTTAFNREPKVRLSEKSWPSFERELRKSLVYQKQSTNESHSGGLLAEQKSARVMNISAALARPKKDEENRAFMNSRKPRDDKDLDDIKGSAQRFVAAMTSTERQIFREIILTAVFDGETGTRKEHEEELLQRWKLVPAEQHKRELAALKATYKAQRLLAENEIARMQNSQANLPAPQEENVKALKERHVEQFRELELSHSQRLQDKNTKLEEAQQCIDKLTKQEQRQMQDVADSKVTVSKLNQELTELKTRRAAQEEEAKQLAHGQRVRQEHLHAESARRIHYMKMDMEWHHQKAAKLHEQEIARLIAEHGGDIEELRTKHATMVTGLKREILALEVKIDMHETHHEDTLERHKQEVADLDSRRAAEMHALHEKHSSKMQSLKQDMQHLERKMQEQEAARKVAEFKHRLLVDHLPMLERLVGAAKMP